MTDLTKGFFLAFSHYLLILKIYLRRFNYVETLWRLNGYEKLFLGKYLNDSKFIWLRAFLHDAAVFKCELEVFWAIRVE